MSRITYQFRVFLAYAVIVFIVLAYTGLVSINVFTGGVTTLLTRLGVQQGQDYAGLASEMVRAGMEPDEVREVFLKTGTGNVAFVDALPDDVDVVSETPDFAFRFTPVENQYYLKVPELDAYLKLVYQTDMAALVQQAQRTFVWEFFMIFLVTATIGFYLTWFTLRQVRVLREALERIGRGDFSERLNFRSHDEFGELAKMIDQTAGQLEKIRQERSTMLNRISHELKTPVSITVNLLYVASKHSDKEEVLEKIETARKHLLLQARLIDDILQAPGLYDELSLDLDLVEAGDVISDAVEPYRIYLDSLGIALAVDMPEACQRTLIEIDSKRMRQVFGNIIHNAARHLSGQPAARLEVALRCEQQSVVIRITDNGPGIRPDIISRIFEPYVSAPGEGHEGMGGSGLGLAISKEIVEAHGGEIGVNSPVENGRGASLIVKLPRFDEEAIFI